jgi:hypothetical protein
MAEETKTSLYNAINALHQTDQAIWSKVQAVSGTIGLENLPEDVAKIITAEGKIAKDLLPQTGINLSFNGKQVGTEITSLNFAGTTTITVDDNGVAKIQIGENMNSSAWTVKDGKQGDGTPTGFPAGSDVIVPNVAGTTTAAFKVGDWTAGTSVKGITSSSITISSTGNIHLDEGINTWNIKVYGETKNVIAEANVNDTVAYDNNSAPTKATVTTSAIAWVTGSAGITHSVTNGAIEDNYPSAVGGRGKVSFTINLAQIAEIQNGGRFSIEISGPGGTYKSEERFYIKESTPAIASATLSFNNDESTRFVSGVKYITAGTYTVQTGNISNLNNQAGVSKRLALTSTGLFSNEDTSITSSELINWNSNWDNVCTYSASLSLSGSNIISGGNASVTLTPYNAKATGSSVTASLSGYNINTFAATDSKANEETFLSENMRLKDDDKYSTPWVSSETLGSTDLQVIPGVGLVYPTGNYSTIATPSGNPNYSTYSGERYFVRKMTAGSGTVFGGTLTLGGSPTWSDITFAKLSIDGGTTWFNLKTARGGADPLGIFNSYTSGIVSFTFPGTTSMTATDGIIIKLGWSKKTTKITKITLAM